MSKSLFAFVVLLLAIVSADAQQTSDPVKITPVGIPCEESPRDPSTARNCREIDALLFVHGIYGDKETFRNGDFDWPSELAKRFGDKTDVYVVEYTTKLFAWVKKDIASFDEIAEAFFDQLHGTPNPGGSGRMSDGLLDRRPYRSIGFIGHSLGGNVIAAYIHSVKSELGHVDRARNSFLVTLGTPANGSQMANVGLLLKAKLQMADTLLKSLEHDNTFLRMLASWRRAEDEKSQRFKCRPVHLYVGVEGQNMFPLMRIVTPESAAEPYRNLARDIKHFDDYDHSRSRKASRC